MLQGGKPFISHRKGPNMGTTIGASLRVVTQVAAAAALLIYFSATGIAFAAGTGGGLQVPNVPAGAFTQPGAPGLCQCIRDDEKLDLMCLTSAKGCEARCGRMYAFMPDAAMSCPRVDVR
jgi:hypothetical protein